MDGCEPGEDEEEGSILKKGANEDQEDGGRDADGVVQIHHGGRESVIF